VTIAIRLCANDGILFAADSQETISGYIKGHVGKVRITLYNSGSVVSYAGAGTSDYIETAIDDASEGLADFLQANSIQNHMLPSPTKHERKIQGNCSVASGHSEITPGHRAF
jgi:hypothetical protein